MLHYYTQCSVSSAPTSTTVTILMCVVLCFDHPRVQCSTSSASHRQWLTALASTHVRAATCSAHPAIPLSPPPLLHPTARPLPQPLVGNIIMAFTAIIPIAYGGLWLAYGMYRAFPNVIFCMVTIIVITFVIFFVAELLSMVRHVTDMGPCAAGRTPPWVLPPSSPPPPGPLWRGPHWGKGGGVLARTVRAQPLAQERSQLMYACKLGGGGSVRLPHSPALGTCAAGIRCPALLPWLQQHRHV